MTIDSTLITCIAGFFVWVLKTWVENLLLKFSENAAAKLKEDLKDILIEVSKQQEANDEEHREIRKEIRFVKDHYLRRDDADSLYQKKGVDPCV
jgi:ABC-type transport system involved in cytochrome bd biosynthesis fused ATPase/permease subunit